MLDTGSIDGTVEKIKQLADEDERVVIISQRPVEFSDDIRSVLHRSLSDNANKGDWIAKIDADETYEINPKKYLSELDKKYDHVFGRYYTFQPSLDDCMIWLENMKSKQALENIRWHSPRTYFFHQSEIRFYKYKGNHQWVKGNIHPSILCCPAPYNLPIIHRPARSPLQLARRQGLRKIMVEKKAFRNHMLNPECHHWNKPWTEYCITDPKWPVLDKSNQVEYRKNDPVRKYSAKARL